MKAMIRLAVVLSAAALLQPFSPARAQVQDWHTVYESAEMKAFAQRQMQLHGGLPMVRPMQSVQTAPMPATPVPSGNAAQRFGTVGAFVPARVIPNAKVGEDLRADAQRQAPYARPYWKVLETVDHIWHECAGQYDGLDLTFTVLPGRRTRLDRVLILANSNIQPAQTQQILNTVRNILGATENRPEMDVNPATLNIRLKYESYHTANIIVPEIKSASQGR